MGVNKGHQRVERAFYPSGPRLDGKSGQDSYSPPPKPDPNPDPNNYKITKAEEHGAYLILMLHYPNCTNYEGNKILVFKATLLEIVNQKTIDPHFFNDKRFKSPVARFVPTDEGWKMARTLVTALQS